MNIWRPKYNIAIVRATTINVENLEEEAGEFEERTNAILPAGSDDQFRNTIEAGKLRDVVLLAASHLCS